MLSVPSKNTATYETKETNMFLEPGTILPVIDNQGQRIGSYRITNYEYVTQPPICTYTGVDTSDEGEPVTIRVLFVRQVIPEQRDQMLRRFLREAKLLEQLASHLAAPEWRASFSYEHHLLGQLHVLVTAHPSNVDTKKPLLTLEEWIRNDRIEAQKRLGYYGGVNLIDALRMVIPLVELAAEMHDSGMVLRSIDPDGIVVRVGGKQTVLAFLTLTGAYIPNTDLRVTERLTVASDMATMSRRLAWHSPEQAGSENPIPLPSMDVYLLMLLFYTIWLGKNPHIQENMVLIRESILHEVPRIPQEQLARISDTHAKSLLSEIVTQAFQKDPYRRQQSARVLLSQMRELCVLLQKPNAMHGANVTAVFRIEHPNPNPKSVLANREPPRATPIRRQEESVTEPPRPLETRAVVPQIEDSPRQDAPSVLFDLPVFLDIQPEPQSRAQSVTEVEEKQPSSDSGEDLYLPSRRPWIATAMGLMLVLAAMATAGIWWQTTSRAKEQHSQKKPQHKPNPPIKIQVRKLAEINPGTGETCSSVAVTPERVAVLCKKKLYLYNLLGSEICREDTTKLLKGSMYGRWRYKRYAQVVLVRDSIFQLVYKIVWRQWRRSLHKLIIQQVDKNCLAQGKSVDIPGIEAKNVVRAHWNGFRLYMQRTGGYPDRTIACTPLLKGYIACKPAEFAWKRIWLAKGGYEIQKTSLHAKASKPILNDLGDILQVSAVECEGKEKCSDIALLVKQKEARKVYVYRIKSDTHEKK